MSDIVPIQPNLIQPPNTFYPYPPTTPSYSPYEPSTNPIVTDIKLSTLFTYTPTQVRDTWANMGSLIISNVTRVYTRNTIFKCNEPTCPLYGALLYCDADYTLDASFTWVNMMLNDITTGTIINSTTYIIDPHFTLVLSKTSFDSIIVPVDTTWVPFQEVNNNSLVLIDDFDLNRVLIEIGVPFIKTIELEYSRDDICNYMIFPALQEFYRWFPIETVAAYTIPTGNFKIPMPPWAFTATKAMVNPGFPVGQVPSNPLYRYFDEVLMSISPRGAFSTPNINSNRRQGFVDTMAFSTYVLERAARTGIMQYSSRQRIRIYNQGRAVTGYSTKRGILEITWGSFSNIWSDIPMNRLPEVRDLAKAYVLRAFASLRMQANSSIPGSINYEQFNTRADQLEQKVLEVWQSSVKAAVIRS